MKKLLRFSAMVLIAIMSLSLTSCITRIGPGFEGLKVALAGSDKGTTRTEPTYGLTVYNPLTTMVVKVYVKNQHFMSEPIVVQAKGGTNVEVHPSFNYRVTPGKTDSLFLLWGVTDDQQIQGRLLEASLLTSLRELTNNYSIDSLLNNRAAYDYAIEAEMNRKLAPFAALSQFTSGVKPDSSMSAAIAEKSASIQKAIAAENKQRETRALAGLDIINAQKDSAVAVIRATGKAEAIRKEQQYLTPVYIDYLKWLNAGKDVPRVPQYVGSGVTTLKGI